MNSALGMLLRESFARLSLSGVGLDSFDVSRFSLLLEKEEIGLAEAAPTAMWKPDQRARARMAV